VGVADQESRVGLLLAVGAFEERLTDDILVFLEDLELAISFGFADVNVLGEVVILLGSHLAARTIEGDAGLKCGHDLGWLEGTGLFYSGLPEIHTIIGENHRRAGHPAFLDDSWNSGLGKPGLEVGYELFVGWALDGLEVSPATKLADQLAGWETAELVFGDGEADDRAGLGVQTSGGVFLEEWNVGVAIEGADDAGITGSGELLDFSNDLLIVGVAEWGVLTGGDDLAAGILGETTADVFEWHALAEEIL